ncbi:MAG: MFS transporter, partial [Acutalibacteraceae bacterium]
MSKLTEKITKTPRGWDTKPRERLSYYLYFCGQNAIYNLVSSFLTTYLMFSFASEAETGVDPLTLTAGIMLVVKIWDAVNDAIFGVIFDKVRFKSGNKFVPWLKISLVFIPLTTVLLFAIPNSLGTNAKLAWLAISYILWDTAYTLCDVPIFGVITAMSENLDERNSILSYKSIWSGIGSGVALILGTVLVGEYVHLNYTVVAVVCAVFALITMIPACFRLEERYVGDRDEEFTLRKMFSYLAKNKYLLIYYIGYFFYSSANVSVALNLFVSFYLFNNSQFSLIVSAISLVPSAIFAFLVPHFIRRMDKMKLFRICTLAAIALSVVMWAVGYSS